MFIPMFWLGVMVTLIVEMIIFIAVIIMVVLNKSANRNNHYVERWR